MNLQQLTLQVANLSRSVGKMLKEELKNFSADKVEIKGMHDFVSYVDKSSEEILVKELSKILPKAGFIAEENTDDRKGDRFNWIIDPLDGTTNFIHGIPLFSISIALMDGGEVISGVVHEVNLNECFYAWKNSPAYLNGNEIKVSSASKLNDSLLATGFPYYDYSRLEPYMQMFQHLLRASHGVRRLGSAAADLAYVACGRFEGFYEYGLHPWDVAAGTLIVKQAGGQVTDFGGSNNYIFGREIIASNGNIHEEFLKELKKYFN
ncbi:MAG: inositol monophosphatase [Bacteroidales bacterium]|nr:inositol monophosphatase [Bacteroidales bacterium]